MVKHTAREIAGYFLANVPDHVGDNLSNLKLQKLLYYAQGGHLALFGEPLFDDAIEAWTHGPVVPSLYHELKAYGAGALPVPDEFDFSTFDEQTRGLLDEIFAVYGQYSAWKLADMTHEEFPCSATPRGAVIPLSLMQDYFKTQLIDG